MALNACFDRLKPRLQCAHGPNLYLTSYSEDSTAEEAKGAEVTFLTRRSRRPLR